MEKRTWYKLIVLLLLASLTLAACGPQETQAPATEAPTEVPATEAPAAEEPTAEEPTSEPVGEKVTIRLSTWAGVEEAAELQEILDEINAERNPLPDRA